MRLVLDVDYDPNGVPDQVLADMLHGVVRAATNHGWLTGGTPAEVDGYTARVEQVDSMGESHQLL
jgi:hypothetical protein